MSHWSPAFLVVVSALMFATGAEPRAIRTARTAQDAAIVAGDVDRAATFWTEGFAARLGGRETAMHSRSGAFTISET